MLSLSVADAYVTLFILGAGGTEINPIMRAMLTFGHRPFVIVKVGLTLAGVAVLFLHKTWPLARGGLSIGLGGYGLLIAYLLAVYTAHRFTG